MKCDESLLQLFLKTEKVHIDYLVDLLTDKGKGRIALSSSIKDLLIQEKDDKSPYTEEAICYLLHELQSFGGNSVMNLIRDNPINYENLLTDVHKKLNGFDSLSKSINQKENEIVVGLFGKDWKDLSKDERLKRCTEKKVVTGFFKLQESLGVDEKGKVIGLPVATSAALFLMLRGNPLTAAAVILNGVVNEAYRITIPFVAQVAYIKMLTK